MLKGFFTALSSKVFGSGQSEVKSSDKDGDENFSGNASEQKSDQVSNNAVELSTEPAIQKKNSNEASADIVVPKPDENNSGSEVTSEEQPASVIYTKSKDDPPGQETSDVVNNKRDWGKGEMTDAKSKDSPSPRSGGNAQDMSEWVTLEMPKSKRSPRNRKSRSPKNQGVKPASGDVSAPSQNQKSMLDSGDVMTEKASSPVDTITPNSKLDKTEKGSEAGGDRRETVENDSGHLDEDSFSSLLVSSMLEEIVGQMSEVTVKDTVKDSQMSEVTVKDSQMSEVTVKDTVKDSQMSEVTVKDSQMSEVTVKDSQMSEVRVKESQDTNQTANQEKHADSVRPQDDNWRTKRPNTPGDEYCREKPQRGKKGMNRRGHKQGYNNEGPPNGDHGEGKEVIEERKTLPPIDPNVEQEDFLQFCKMNTERDKLIRAKKLIYKLGYLKDVPQDEIKDVIRGQYKIAAKRSVHGWIEDARYFSEVMISRDWIDENLLYLNPRMNKKSSNKRNKNRYMEKEDSFARKTGGLCQDVRLLTNPNLTVVRVNMKSNGRVEAVKGESEGKGEQESKEVSSSGEKLVKTEEGNLKTANDQDGKKEDGLKVEMDKDNNVDVTAVAENKDGEDQFEDCLEESVKDTDKAEGEKKEAGASEKSGDGNSGKAVEEIEGTVEQVTEVVALMEECVISGKEQDMKFDGDKDVQGDDNKKKEKQESEKQLDEFATSNESFTDPAIIMMVKSSGNSEDLPGQPSYGIEMPAYDPKCDVLSGLFRIEEDPRSLIETIMHSDSPTEPSVTRDYPQAVIMSQDDPAMVMENDSQLIDYLLTVTEEPKNPTMFPEISCIVENASDSLAELEGIDDFLTDIVTSKICNEDIIADIDTAGIGEGGFGEEVVNLDLVKDESVMKLIEQCRTEDLAEGESCEGAGEAPALEGQGFETPALEGQGFETPALEGHGFETPALEGQGFLEGQVLEEGEVKESIQHFGDPVESEMVCNLLQDLPILDQKTSNASSKEDCIGSASDHKLTGEPANVKFEEAVVGEVTKDSTVTVSCFYPDNALLELGLVESLTGKEPYSPTQSIGLCTGPDHLLSDDLAGGEIKEAVVGEGIKDSTVALPHQDTDHAQIELVVSQTDKEPYSPTQKCVESYSPA